jgi:hypothetical protein
LGGSLTHLEHHHGPWLAVRSARDGGLRAVPRALPRVEEQLEAVEVVNPEPPILPHHAAGKRHGVSERIRKQRVEPQPAACGSIQGVRTHLWRLASSCSPSGKCSLTVRMGPLLHTKHMKRFQTCRNKKNNHVGAASLHAPPRGAMVRRASLQVVGVAASAHPHARRRRCEHEEAAGTPRGEAEQRCAVGLQRAADSVDGACSWRGVGGIGRRGGGLRRVSAARLVRDLRPALAGRRTAHRTAESVCTG